MPTKIDFYYLLADPRDFVLSKISVNLICKPEVVDNIEIKNVFRLPPGNQIGISPKFHHLLLS